MALPSLGLRPIDNSDRAFEARRIEGCCRVGVFAEVEIAIWHAAIVEHGVVTDAYAGRTAFRSAGAPQSEAAVTVPV